MGPEIAATECFGYYVNRVNYEFSGIILWYMVEYSLCGINGALLISVVFAP